MPRFAANLGFSPLEPMKPSSVSGTTSSTNSSVSNEIPAAQFDWNSSGLVNPLDGKRIHLFFPYFIQRKFISKSF